MPLTLLPAVDVADGRSVRLVRGAAGSATVHGSPLDAALAWQADGAEWIHLVDIDAAFGRGSNADLLARVIGELDVDVQLSGGVHDDASLERALATGCARVVLATTAVADPEWCRRAIAAHGARVVVGIDVRVVEDPDGTARHRLAPRGGTRGGGDLWEALERLDRDGCARYVVTDVSRDGALSGPNLELYREVARTTSGLVLASGGVAAIGDLVALAEVAATAANLEGAVVGSALYAGRFTLPEAAAALGRVDGPSMCADG